MFAYELEIIFYFHGATVPSGPEPPHRELTITDTPQSVGLLLCYNGVL